MFIDLIAQNLWPDRFIDLTAKKCGKIGSYMLLPKLCDKIGSQILLPKNVQDRQILQCYLQNLWQDRFPTAKKMCKIDSSMLPAKFLARQVRRSYWHKIVGRYVHRAYCPKHVARKTNRSYQHKIVGRQVQLPTNF